MAIEGERQRERERPLYSQHAVLFLRKYPATQRTLDSCNPYLNTNKIKIYHVDSTIILYHFKLTIFNNQ